jgi:hypothetical protein
MILIGFPITTKTKACQDWRAIIPEKTKYFLFRYKDSTLSRGYPFVFLQLLHSAKEEERKSKREQTEPLICWRKVLIFTSQITIFDFSST